MNRTASKTIKYLLSLALAGVLVYFALRSVDWSAFASGLRETRWGYAILFFFVSVLALVFRAERWRSMMLPLDPEVKRSDTWDSANVGNVTNVVLPGAGEFVRCAYISSKRMTYDKAFGTIVSERAWDMFAVAVLFVAAIAAQWNTFGKFFVDNIWKPLGSRADFSLWWAAAAAVLLIAVYLVLVFRLRRRSKFFERNAKTLSNLWAGLASITKVRNKWAFILYTVGIWIMYMLMCYFIFQAVPELSHLTMIDALLISSIGNIASVIPVPGGIGAYHYLVALALQTLYGASWETGILAATLNHELHAILIIVVGLVSYLRLTIRKKNAADTTA